MPWETFTVEQRVRVTEILNKADADDWLSFDKAMLREIEMQDRHSKATR